MTFKRVESAKISDFLDPESSRGTRRELGIFQAVVKNNADTARSGRLQVFVPALGGIETEQSNWFTVSYANPYMGATRRPQEVSLKSKENQYKDVNHAYGMWFTPPDIGNFVLIAFTNGDVSQGFWFACIMPDISHWAIPGQAGAFKVELSKEHQDLNEALTLPPYPTVEFNEENDKTLNDRDQFVSKLFKPPHENQCRILLNQGLEDDKVRGVVSSSSQRESPSCVFGISTPGREGDSVKQENRADVVAWRKGGHTFVMDDGDMSGKDQMVRLRTAGGHQILMNDQKEVLYISHSSGNSWMEFNKDGKINAFCKSDFTIRSESNINFHADNDINMFAKNNIKMYSGKSIQEQSDLISRKATTEIHDHGGKINALAGTTWRVTAGTEGSIGTGTQIVYSSGMIYLNTQAAPNVPPVAPIPVAVFPDSEKKKLKWKHTAKVSSTVPVVPTHEPYLIDHPAGAGGGTSSTTVIGSADAASQAGSASSGITTGKLGVGPANAAGKGVSKVATTADLANQPQSVKGVGSLSALEKDALKAQLAKTESGALGYAAVGGDKGHFLGKYQMGASALVDQGFVNPGTTGAGLDDPANWTGKDGITSKSAFLASGAAQEKAMDGNLDNNFKTLTKLGVINADSPHDDISGKLAASHLVGAGGVAQWVNGSPKADAFGTTADTYYNNGRYANTVLAATSLPATNGTQVAKVATVTGGKITPVTG